MRALLLGDIHFQYKYGFYFLYIVFSILYIALLFVFPNPWREKAAIVMIFSDPSAMGLFFMGAIILFEKSERVLNSIAISPVKPTEYVLSKLGSIGLIATIVGVVIGIMSGRISNMLYLVIGVFLCSCIFSSIGLMVAANVASLNQFTIWIIPAEILINVPAIAYLFGFHPTWLLLHPGVSMIELCLNGKYALPGMFILFGWTVLFTLMATKVIHKMLQSVGGVKL
jgi:fluoroquinolone transport system permease protein